MNNKILKVLNLIIFVSFIGGCVTIEKNSLFTSQAMFNKAEQKKFRKVDFEINQIKFTGYHKLRLPTASSLSVYIEDDENSMNNPIAFYLASEDSYANVLYLVCLEKVLSSEVVDAFNAVIDQVKLSSGAQKVSLTGYSKGAAAAVLVAGKRNDVSSLRTVAGKLSEVLAEAEIIKNIPQRHFVGSRDSVVPKSVAKNFILAQKDKSHKSLTIVSAGHLNGWVEAWSKLLKYPLEKK